MAELQRRMSSREFAHWIAFYLWEAEEEARAVGREPVRVRRAQSGAEVRRALGQALGVG